MRRRAMGPTLVALMMMAAASSAEEIVVGLKDVATVENGRGAARLLFRTNSFTLPARALIETATLTVPYSGAAEDRVQEVRVCPVTASRSGSEDWTTPYDEELYARADLSLREGHGVLVFDVTVPLREMLAGISADGFLLTVPSATGGLRSDDVQRLGDLTTARLTVTTTTLPSGLPPAQWLERAGLQ